MESALVLGPLTDLAARVDRSKGRCLPLSPHRPPVLHNRHQDRDQLDIPQWSRHIDCRVLEQPVWYNRVVVVAAAVVVVLVQRRVVVVGPRGRLVAVVQ